MLPWAISFGCRHGPRLHGGRPLYGAWVASANWVRFALSPTLQKQDPGGRMIYSTGSIYLLSVDPVAASPAAFDAGAGTRLVGARSSHFPIAGWDRDPPRHPCRRQSHVHESEIASGLRRTLSQRGDDARQPTPDLAGVDRAILGRAAPRPDIPATDMAMAGSRGGSVDTTTTMAGDTAGRWSYQARPRPGADRRHDVRHRLSGKPDRSLGRPARPAG